MTKALFIPLLLSAAMLVLMLAFPEQSLSAAVSGVNDFITVIFPSLFPFMFGSTLLMKTGILKNISTVTDKISRKLFGCGGEFIYIYLCSILSGYPTGAKLACDLYASNIITARECAKIINATSVSGPLFISGVVSISVLGSAKAFPYIFFPHIFSALITAIILRKTYISKRVSLPETDFYDMQYDAGQMIAESFFSCFKTSALICGYVIVFAVITKGIFSGLENGILRSVFTGVLEMSNGILSIRETNIGMQMKMLLAECMITFGGISILMQTRSITGAHKIKNPYFLPAKLLQTAVACLLCWLIIRLDMPYTNISIPV